MDYIYNGEVNIFQENLDRFLSVAQRLKLEGLIGKGDSKQDIYNYKDDTNSAKEEYETNEGYYEQKISNREQEKSRPPASSVDKVIVPLAYVDMNEIDNTINQHFEKLGGKGAKASIGMKRHIETHLEGLSYPCQVCGKTFRSRNSFNTHKVTFHGK